MINQTIEIQTAGKGKIKVPITNRFVFMKLDKKFRNFYWLGGPFPEDKNQRITVLHHGQT